MGKEVWGGAWGRGGETREAKTAQPVMASPCGSDANSSTLPKRPCCELTTSLENGCVGERHRQRARTLTTTRASIDSEQHTRTRNPALQQRRETALD